MKYFPLRQYILHIHVGANEIECQKIVLRMYSTLLRINVFYFASVFLKRLLLHFIISCPVYLFMSVIICLILYFVPFHRLPKFSVRVKLFQFLNGMALLVLML